MCYDGVCNMREKIFLMREGTMGEKLIMKKDGKGRKKGESSEKEITSKRSNK